MSVVDQTSGVSYATLSAAIAGSSANDVIQISPGPYVESFPDITHDLTIEAVGGLAYLSNPLPDPPNGRAVINVPGNLNVSLTLSGLDISGAMNDATNPPSSGGANGAGILFEFGNGALVVENCHIHNNEDGILTGGANGFSLSGMTATIINSEFDHNGVDPSNTRYGFDHNLYAGGPLSQLTIFNSYFHDALGGHEIKSDANVTVIRDSRIQDGPTAGTSYSVDLPSGGVATIENNVIEKGPNSQNDAFIHYGGDVPAVSPNSSLTISDNTVIDDKASGQGPFVFDGALSTNGGPIVVPVISGNTFYGPSPDNLLAGPNIGDAQSGAPYVSINSFLPVSEAPTLDTSPPVPCYRTGTRIRTERGEVAVEELRVGDRIPAVHAGASLPVVWIGHRLIQARPHPRPEDVYPVCIAAGAFGDFVPHNDLWLSPEHCVFLHGVLVPIRVLINGTSIVQVPCNDVTYWHVELESHDLMLCEGAWAESYLDMGNRGSFTGTDDAQAPDFSREAWEERACQQQERGGPVVAAIRAVIDARAQVRIGSAALQHGFDLAKHKFD